MEDISSICTNNEQNQRYSGVYLTTFLLPTYGTTGMHLPVKQLAVNIAENDNDYRIEVAAPGLKKDDINIDLDENVLTISSEQEDKKEENEENYTRKEFSYCSFKLSGVLPDNVFADKIEAHHKDGSY